MAGSSQYTAIYSSLAIIIIFMIWLYVSWLVVLVGASVGFYMQHTECLMASPGEEPRLSSQSQDQLALAIMQTLGERYLQGSTPLQAGELAQRFHTPGYAIDAILEALAARGIVVRTDRTDPPGWIPGRDLGNITPWQVLEAVRHAGEIHPPDPAADDTIQTFFYAQDQMSAVLSTISFRDLLTRPAGSRTVLTPSLVGGGAGAVAASLQAVAASAAPVLPHGQIMGGVALADEELGGGVGLRSTAQRRAALQQLERQAQREGRQATPAVRDPGDDWDAIPTGTGRLCATDAAAMASFPAVAAPLTGHGCCRVARDHEHDRGYGYDRGQAYDYDRGHDHGYDRCRDHTHGHGYDHCRDHIREHGLTLDIRTAVSLRGLPAVPPGRQ